jgi:hypothetical protein
MIALIAALLLMSPQTGARAPEPVCTIESAIQTDVRAISVHPEKWFGRCVSLQGYTSLYTFYDDVGGLYRRSANDEADRPNDGWLGLYVVPGGGLRTDFHRASVFGIVDSCERIYERAEAALQPNEIIFLTGYCHYTSGLILQRAEVIYQGQARFMRQIGERKRASMGDLAPASATNPVPPAVRAKIEAWRIAFRAADEAKLRSIVQPYDWTADRRPDLAKRLGPALTGAAGPFKRLRDSELAPAFFSERVDEEDLQDGVSADWFACFCKVSDCSGRWPIATFDATAQASRPYVCLRIYKAFDGSGVLEIGLSSIGNGLIEPKRH